MTDRFWVLIECGSTQDFIFQSNRQRFHVGASALITDLPIWVTEAAQQATGVSIIAAVSGSAVLLTDDRDGGRSVVRAVTERALSEAPGLDIWGYVDDQPTSSLNAMVRLSTARQGFERARVSRSSSKARSPMMPFLDHCAITGLPASRRRHALGSPSQPVSVTADAALRRAPRSHRKWKSLLGDAVVEDLDQDLSPEGWTAVIHADGNGIGAMIDDLESPDDYHNFSCALDAATNEALMQAVNNVEGKHWILPILVGGDDVTVYCKASKATMFTREYLRAFEELTSAKLPDKAKLTASAGVAFVKPHYPFSEAHSLAQQLTRFAKDGLRKLTAADRSAWDFHVLYDSLARPLDVIRENHGHAIVAPLLVSPVNQKTGLARGQAANEDGPIIHAMEELLTNEPPLSNKAQHALRDALLQPQQRRADILDRVKKRVAAVGGTSAEKFIMAHLDAQKSLLTVMDLADVTTGTSRMEN